MPTFNAAKLLKGEKKKWYDSERNTAELLRAVVEAKNKKPLSGEDIWHLLQLTWCTKAEDHWKRLKIPALHDLFERDKPFSPPSDAARGDVLKAMSLPKRVAEAAANPTGNIDLYKAYRNSSKDWCEEHETKLRDIIREAFHLANEQGRLALADKIDRLPKVPTPSGARHKSPGDVLTPLVAFLDPHRRFPMINQRKEVQALLAQWELRGRNLKEQVLGMTRSIGRFGISDAFVLDVLADEIKKIAPELNTPIEVRAVKPASGSPLPDFDAAEREYFHQAGTVRYRHRHDKMTTELKKILHGFKLTQGSRPDCRWDVLIERYDATGRDLLLEVKPDPEKAAIRIAVGQLFDYRRFVPRPAATDIALLTIGAPDKLYRQLLVNELQISSIWFTDEDCSDLNGKGPFWEALKETLATLANL
ncbi:MAG: hypothetical protein WAM89_05260 [Terriglobales bacterium]